MEYFNLICRYISGQIGNLARCYLTSVELAQESDRFSALDFSWTGRKVARNTEQEPNKLFSGRSGRGMRALPRI